MAQSTLNAKCKALLTRMLGRHGRNAQRGYGLALIMVFLASTVLIGTSIQMVMGTTVASTLGTNSQDNLAARELAQSAIETVVADMQSNLDAGTAVTTAYTYPATNITMPTDSSSLGGGTSTVGSFSAAVTTARGNTYVVVVTATVGSATINYSRTVTLIRNSKLLDSIANSTAAFSLRKLRSAYAGSAIRVRRSSDNTEQDIGFDGNGNLDISSLKTFLSASTMPGDAVSSPIVAFGLRKLRSAYTGYAIQVRRSSDNTTQDIGFTSGGDLDVSSLLSFVGTGSGYVTTWYDQSGNGTNATQATANSQPSIVLSGVLNMVNNRPAIKYVGIWGSKGDVLNFSRTISDDFTIMACFTTIAGDWSSADTNWYGHSGIVDMEVSGGSGNDFGTSVDLSGNIYGGVGGDGITPDNSISATSPGYNDNRMHWMAFTRKKSTGSFNVYADNASYAGPNAAPNTNSLTGSSTISIGNLNSGARQSINGYINEVLVYNSVLNETNRKVLQRNESWYYNMAPVASTLTYPVDTIGGTATAAYGLRKLRSGANSVYAIRVRRSSDNTTQIIGFEANGNLDVSALMTFVGSGSGYVDNWYDQSGNNNDISQATQSKQPMIVNAGVLVTENGRPALQFTAASSSSMFRGAILSAGQTAYTYMAVAKPNFNASSQQVLMEQNMSSQTNNRRAALSMPNAGGTKYGFVGESNDNWTIIDANVGNQSQITMTMDTAQATNIHMYLNGTHASGASTAPGSLNLGNSAFAIGYKYPTNNEYWSGTISEVLVYNSVLTGTQIQTFAQNDLQYFSPPLPSAYVTKWYDQSGNGNDVTQTNPMLQPTITLSPNSTINTVATVQFNGTQTLYNSTSGMPTSADFSKVAVYSYYDSSKQNPIIGSTQSTSNQIYMGGTNYLKFWNNSNYLTSSLLMTSNIAYAIAGVYTQSSPTRTGTLYRSNTSGGTATTGFSSGNASIALGSQNLGASGYLTGTISEALIFSRVTTSTERTTLYNDERNYFGAQ